MNNNFYMIVMILFLTFGCKNETKKIEEVSKTEITEEFNVLGSYVSDDYSKRSEGYDWVAVSVTKTESNNLNISIRSRADKKEPTCTFDAVAKKMEDSTYQTQINGTTNLFEFINGKDLSGARPETEHPVDTHRANDGFTARYRDEYAEAHAIS